MNSNRKGKAGEREFAEVLRSAGWPNARRGQQRAGVDQPDVIGGPQGVHFEVKRVQSLNLGAAMRQATRDAGAGEVPVVAHRRNGEAWLATLPLDALLSLLRLAERAGAFQEPDDPTDALRAFLDG